MSTNWCRILPDSFQAPLTVSQEISHFLVLQYHSHSHGNPLSWISVRRLSLSRLYSRGDSTHPSGLALADIVRVSAGILVMFLVSSLDEASCEWWIGCCLTAAFVVASSAYQMRPLCQGKLPSLGCTSVTKF